MIPDPLSGALWIVGVFIAAGGWMGFLMMLFAFRALVRQIEREGVEHAELAPVEDDESEDLSPIEQGEDGDDNPELAYRDAIDAIDDGYHFSLNFMFDRIEAGEKFADMSEQLEDPLAITRYAFNAASTMARCTAHAGHDADHWKNIFWQFCNHIEDVQLADKREDHVRIDH
ncbi:hypothetical protein [Cupriavidus metallidurans]|uniref:hypothetical protein n=1 Tax=Cupriavidus metallidurans TaxID=119219 RepID=UPI000787314E|nr:hypothetical protein [Cupriavidus metallidurans]